MSGPGVIPSFPQVVRITSETAQVATVRAAVLEAARAIGFAAAEVSAVALAIDEAVTNVIRHGYEGCSGQPIEVVIDRVEREGRPALQVTIRDFGRQVDPAMIVGRDLEDVRPGGLGTHIIRTIMDEVEYSRRDPTGMQLRVLKVLRLPDKAASPAQASGSKESN
jgi:anti-sigma regulatory factor (Ser/Thr protein kinase)